MTSSPLSKPLAKFKTEYGAGPIHLMAIGLGLAVSGYAAYFLLATRAVHVAFWFIASAVTHDVIVLPAYVALDLGLIKLASRRGSNVSWWINFIRFPAAISLLLLVIFYPEISHRHTALYNDSGESTSPYLTHWLIITAVLFGISGLAYAVRRFTRRTA